MREEKDSIGKINVPEDAFYGISTLRALDSFPITNERVNLGLIKAFLTVKKAAAGANRKIGKLDADKHKFIIQAVDLLIGETEQAAGKESFSIYEKVIIDPYHGGAAFPLNANINEIIANTALRIMGKKLGSYENIHPVNDINMSQSENGVYLTALKIASVLLMREMTESFSVLKKALEEKRKEFDGVVKLGRDRLQDANAITLGQEFESWAGMIDRDIKQLLNGGNSFEIIYPGSAAADNLSPAEEEYTRAYYEELKRITELPLERFADTSKVNQNLDEFLSVHGLIRSGASSIIKICNDLRLLASGPYGGLGEISLPPVYEDNGLIQENNNPAVLENTLQAAELVKGHDAVISNLVSAGNLETNAFLPLIAHLFLKSIEMLRDSVINLTVKCIQGIEANVERCRQNLLGSNAVAASLINIFGFDKITKILKESEEKGISVVDLLKQKKILSEKELVGLISREMGINSERRT